MAVPPPVGPTPPPPPVGSPVTPASRPIRPDGYVDEPNPPPLTGAARITAGSNVLVIGDSHLDTAYAWNGSRELAQLAHDAKARLTSMALGGSRIEVWTGHYAGKGAANVVFNERYTKLVAALDAAKAAGKSFSHVVVELGTNDEIWHGKHSARGGPEIRAEKRDVKELLELLHAHNPDVQVLWIGALRLPKVGSNSREAIRDRNGGSNEEVRQSTRAIVEATPWAHYFPSHNTERMPADQRDVHLYNKYGPWLNDWWHWATGAGQR